MWDLLNVGCGITMGMEKNVDNNNVIEVSSQSCLSSAPSLSKSSILLGKRKSKVTSNASKTLDRGAEMRGGGIIVSSGPKHAPRLVTTGTRTSSMTSKTLPVKAGQYSGIERTICTADVSAKRRPISRPEGRTKNSTTSNMTPNRTVPLQTRRSGVATESDTTVIPSLRAQRKQSKIADTLKDVKADVASDFYKEKEEMTKSSYLSVKDVPNKSPNEKRKFSANPASLSPRKPSVVKRQQISAKMIPGRGGKVTTGCTSGRWTVRDIMATTDSSTNRNNTSNSYAFESVKESDHAQGNTSPRDKSCVKQGGSDANARVPQSIGTSVIGKKIPSPKVSQKSTSRSTKESQRSSPSICSKTPSSTLIKAIKNSASSLSDPTKTIAPTVLIGKGDQDEDQEKHRRYRISKGSSSPVKNRKEAYSDPSRGKEKRNETVKEKERKKHDTERRKEEDKRKGKEILGEGKVGAEKALINREKKDQRREHERLRIHERETLRTDKGGRQSTFRSPKIKPPPDKEKKSETDQERSRSQEKEKELEYTRKKSGEIEKEKESPEKKTRADRERRSPLVNRWEIDKNKRSSSQKDVEAAASIRAPKKQRR